MTAKEKLIHEIFLLSSGTVSTFINATRYYEIDRASARTMEYVAANLTETECEAIHTLEDFANLFRKAYAASK